MTAVLVAEDNPAQRQGMAELLRQAGFDVYTARDGTEALELGRRCRPDAAICDWDLGDSPDGAEVVEILKAAIPQLVPILVSGNDLTKLRERTRSLDVASCFSKPVSPPHLLQALREAGCAPRRNE